MCLRKYEYSLAGFGGPFIGRKIGKFHKNIRCFCKIGSSGFNVCYMKYYQKSIFHIAKTILWVVIFPRRFKLYIKLGDFLKTKRFDFCI